MPLAIHTFSATDKGAAPNVAAVAVAFDAAGHSVGYVVGLSPGWCAARLSELLDEQARQARRRDELRQRDAGVARTVRATRSA